MSKGSLPRPSVIRLNRQVKRYRPRLRLTRQEIYRRDDFKCQYCGRRDKELTLDHVFPQSRGGKNTWENLVTACKPCNLKKADRTPQEAGMRLFKEPKEPFVSYYHHFTPYLKKEPAWADYVIE